MKETSSMVQVSRRRNLDSALCLLKSTSSQRNVSANAIVEFPDDGELFVKLMKAPSTKENSTNESNVISLGFVKLPSRKTSTFADARKVIEDELVPDAISVDAIWKFFIPNLGPVSWKQEATLGPMRPFLHCDMDDLNFGTLKNPINVFVVEAAL